MGTTKPLNTVLIGLGMVADTHLQAIANLQDIVHLKGVYTRNQDAAQAYTHKVEETCGYGCEVYSSIDAIAADTDLDFAIILTPPNARLAIVEAFTEAGLPMLMEKPIERSYAAAEVIVSMCEARDTPLGIVFQHRAGGSSSTLRQKIQAGELGKLGMVNVYIPWWRDQAYYDEPGRGTYARDGGGVLMTQAIHVLDLMISLTGEVSEVQAMCRTSAFHEMEAEDFVSAGLTFKNGAIGSLMATTASFPGNSESITLHFDHAVAEITRGLCKLNWRDGRSEEFGEDTATGSGANPMAFGSSWHGTMIKDFAESLIEKREPLASGRESLKVHQLIEALVASSNARAAVEV
ncbi:Gfo/Idh/MocA family protein [Leucothrix mucor]|uniref:Gfo/Idh/MocA family protein n=1 Tax=Leucothrix mucor TaxID=45248 RepID=UPI0003B34A28|nr:Gfo/Idh/MocA family oxidoreductase [Leucothrix mucor]